MNNKPSKRSASFKLLHNQVTYDNSWRKTWRIFNSEKKVLEIPSSIEFMMQHKDVASLFQQLLNLNNNKNNNNRAILKTVITTLLTVKNISYCIHYVLKARGNYR